MFDVDDDAVSEASTAYASGPHTPPSQSPPGPLIVEGSPGRSFMFGSCMPSRSPNLKDAVIGPMFSSVDSRDTEHSLRSRELGERIPDSFWPLTSNEAGGRANDLGSLRLHFEAIASLRQVWAECGKAGFVKKVSWLFSDCL